MPTLLAVDDEKEFTSFIKSYFEPRGFSVSIASDGGEGIELAEELKPDVALIDYKMPSVNGDQVLLRMKIISPKTKTIMITASEGYGKLRSRFSSMGAFACFDKPLASVRDLETKVKEALNQNE